MIANSFFVRCRDINVGEACEIAGARLNTPQFVCRQIHTLTNVENAIAGALLFANGKAYQKKLADLPDCTLICTEELVSFVGSGVAILVSENPQLAFATIGAVLFPNSVSPRSFGGKTGISPAAHVSSLAKIEQSVTIEAGAVIGDHVEIGSDSVIGPNAVIGSHCKIGRDCIIGPSTSILNALIGNRVIILAGARIGQDGFGFTAGVRGLQKMPHIGRVILQDDVEVGSNTTIDRGALTDTIVGEGTKIDNLVQIAHNVKIGRNSVFAGHCGISGSVTIGDNVMLGGRVGLADHITIGNGVQLIASSGVMHNIPDNERWGGSPAQPVKEWLREHAAVRDLVKQKRKPAQ